MASKIQSHNFYVAITPYKVEGSSADEFNLLNVRTAYDDRRKYFYVDLHAGWDTGWGGFGCILMGFDNPLTGPKYVKVKDAPKNSQKTINEMGANLELAKDAIAWLFNERKWDELNRLVKDVAIYGYTYTIEERMKELRRYQNSDTTETTNQNNTTMATVEMNNETKDVQNNAQVNNNAASIEDVNVGEVTVDSIMPVMQPVEEKKADVRCEKADVKPQTSSIELPLGSHGTLVIAGVGGDKPKSEKPRGIMPKVTLKRKTPQTSSISPQTSSLPRVTLVVYTTKRGEQAPRIEGFGGENDPRWKRHYDDKVRLAKEKKEADAFNEKLTEKMKGKPKAERDKLRKQWKSVGSDPFNAGHFTDLTTGDKTYHMLMGAKYLDVAGDLVDAYNSGDETAIAAAEQAVIDCKNGIVKDIEAQRDAKRAEREAKKAAAPAAKAQAEPAMSAEDKAMFDLFKKFMAGDKDAMAKVGAVLKAA